MRSHFDYLADDDAQLFFQKTAEDIASHQVPSAFDKVASRLETDIHMIKTAGPCGGGLPTIDRADAYLRGLLELDLTPEQGEVIFDKVAAEAITTDVDALATHIATSYPEEHQRAATEYLRKLAADITEAAMLDKVAFVGKLLGRAGAAVSGVKEMAKSQMGKWTAKRLKRKSDAIIQGTRATRAAPGRARTAYQEGQRKYWQGRKAKHTENLRRKQDANPYVRQHMDEAYRAPGGRPVVKKQMKTTPTGRGRAMMMGGQRDVAAGKVKPDRAGASTGSRGTADTQHRKAQTDAKDAAGGKVDKGGKADTTVAAPGTKVTITDAMDEVSRVGWGAASPQARSALVKAGVFTVAGSRILSGRDVGSGDKD